MKYPTMRFVFDRKKLATKQKKGLVQIEVLSERKKKYISTSVKLYSDQWHDKRKVINSVNSIIDLKNLKEETEKQVDKIVNERISDMYVCLMSYVDSTNVDSELMTKHPEMAIDFLFVILDNSTKRMYNISVINDSMTRLYAICTNNPYKGMNIYKYKKNHYLSILSDIKHDYKDYVASVISKSNETIDCPYGKGEAFLKI